MTTGVLCPPIILQFFGNDGSPLINGTVLTQIGGVNAATYQDQGLTTPLQNPIPLNSRGEISNASGVSCQLFLTPNVVYTFTTYDSQGNQIWVGNYINGVQVILNQATVGGALWPQTVAEATAGIVPSNFAFQPGDVRRYGADPTGVNDSGAAFVAAFETGQTVSGGDAQCTYTYAGNILIPLLSNVRFDGQGCTLYPTGSAVITNTNVISAAVTFVQSGGGTQGATSFTVNSATGLAVGQILMIQGVGFPTFFTTILSLAGAVVGVDYAFPLNYSGLSSISVTAFNPSSMYQTVQWRNVKYNLAGLTASNAALGMCLRTGNSLGVLYENIEIVNSNSVPGTSTMTLLEVFQSRQVRITGVRTHEITSAISAASGSMVTVEVDDCQAAIVTNCQLRGEAFGINITRCTQSLAEGNTLSASSSYEWQNGYSSIFSTRGIKMTTNATAQVIGNSIDDYGSPIKVDVAWRAIIKGNSVRNNAYSPGVNTTESAIECTSVNDANQYGYIISDNVIENAGGLGIYFDNGAGTAFNTARANIHHNWINSCAAQAIFVNNPDCDISDNFIANWDLVNAGVPAIQYSFGATVNNNQFVNGVTNKVCIGTNFQSTYTYGFSGNKSPTGNPIFAGGAQSDVGGSAMINASATSAVVSHGLPRTPYFYEINITGFGNNPATPTGNYWVTALTPTTFTINVATAPGVGGFLVFWRATLMQSWTQ